MSFIQSLKEWQEIIGAFIGGITGFIAAYMVAYGVRRRDEDASAKILITDLLTISVRTEATDKDVERKNIPDERKKLEFALSYLMKRPILSSLFNSSMAQVISCHENLGIHLSIFSMVYRNVDDSLTWFSNYSNEYYKNQKQRPLTEQTKNESEIIYDGLHLASQHAKCIIYMLNTFVLPSLAYRIWNKFITFVLKKCQRESEEEKSCDCLRKNPE